MWPELAKYYDCTIINHPSKVNIVVDALSMKNIGHLSALCTNKTN